MSSLSQLYEEEQRFLNDGEVIYLPYEPEISKQASTDSNDSCSEALVKLKNSKYMAQLLLTDHSNEVPSSRFVSGGAKNVSQTRHQGGPFVIQQPVTRSMNSKH